MTSNANTAYTDTSDAPFTISGPTLDVTAPDGGERWRMGSMHDITWTYTENPGGKVKIQLLKAGTAVRTLAAEAPVGSGGQGSFAWTIPGDLTVASNYKIKITHTAIRGMYGARAAATSASPRRRCRILGRARPEGGGSGKGDVERRQFGRF